MYTAVVINKEDRNKLTSALSTLPEWLDACVTLLPMFVDRTPLGDRLPHHLTLNIGSIEDGLNNPSVLGKVADLTVEAFCWDHEVGACAARVTKMVVKGFTSVSTIDLYIRDTEIVLKSTNAQPHITMCLMPNVKPAASNNLDWDQAFLLKTPLIISGVVKEEN